MASYHLPSIYRSLVLKLHALNSMVADQYKLSMVLISMDFRYLGGFR